MSLAPSIRFVWADHQTLSAAAALGIKAAAIVEGVETAVRALGDDVTDEVLRYTPGPGYLEVPRTWVRTGRLRRSIRPRVTRNGMAVELVVDAEDVPYGRWIEEGVRDDPRYGRVFMKVRPGGYRMFERGREFMASDRVRESLAKAVRRAWAA